MGPLGRPLRYGMVGGGPGAFIGAVHRRAAALDGLAQLTAGSFSSDPAKSEAHGRNLGLDSSRVYHGFREMAEREAALPPDRRIDFVSIVTPNHLHFPVAQSFVERGFHVVCDKPMTTSLHDAESLVRLVRERDVVFALTHNYTGYPMIKQARSLIAEGRLGPIRKVLVDYVQGWLAEPVESRGNRQAEWRTDPQRAGAGAIGDIGTHADNLARYVTGLEPERMLAEVTTFVEGREVDDDVALFVRYAEGARGVISCCQVAVGEENNLRIRVYGTEASLDWHHERPNRLLLRRADGNTRVFTRGGDGLTPAAARAGERLPAGHPEGFLESFANVYRNAMGTIAARIAGTEPERLDLDFPGVHEGARGVHFIESALKSGRRGEWVDAGYTPPGSPSEPSPESSTDAPAGPTSGSASASPSDSPDVSGRAP